MPRSDDSVIVDIVDAARCIGEFLLEVDQSGFMQDREKQSAVLHQLMVLGEAVKRLSTDFREAHADVPWSNIAAMRDRLIHLYDDVDLQVVWDAATEDVPKLLSFVVSFLPDAPP